MVRPFQSPEAQKNSTIYFLQEDISRNERSFFHVLFWRNLYADGPDKMFIVKNYTWNGTAKDDAPEKDFSLEFSHISLLAIASTKLVFVNAQVFLTFLRNFAFRHFSIRSYFPIWRKKRELGLDDVRIKAKMMGPRTPSPKDAVQFEGKSREII